MRGNYNFTKEELRQLQLKSLDILVYFRDFCKENKLNFCLCGGCCIGTVRNKGFIPWDDDIDIFMPREDYEKLKNIWNEKADINRYSYCITDEKNYYRNLFATINDNNTTFIKTHQIDLDINHGIVLDILPLDGCPDSNLKRRCQIFWALIYSLFCAQVIPMSHGKIVTLLGKVILGCVQSKKLRYRIWKFAEKQMTKYKIKDCNNITELCSGPYYMTKQYPKEIFEEVIYMDFEGELMPVPKGYDIYLKIAFGDYMKLPPKEKQVPHHDVVFCDLLNSYKKYKGKYYCRED